MGYKVEIGVSNKHLHLCREHIDILFGKGHELTNLKGINQPGQFACEEKVDVEGPKGIIKGLRVLGPARSETQVELALTDARGVGIKVPIRESGKLEGSPGCRLIGPVGAVELTNGVIAAQRHIHLSDEDALEAGVSNEEIVSVRIIGNGERSLVLEQVMIRSGECHFKEMHIDTDEGNAAGCCTGDLAEIIKVSS